MRYFVIGDNGELYGPADIETLNQWIAEGRLTPTSMIQEELGGARFAASLLSGLSFSAGYPRAASISMTGEQEFRWAWILGGVGFLCCTYLTPVSLVLAVLAKKKGHPKANAAIIFCTTVTILSIAWAIYFYSIGGMEGLLKMLR